MRLAWQRFVTSSAFVRPPQVHAIAVSGRGKSRPFPSREVVLLLLLRLTTTFCSHHAGTNCSTTDYPGGNSNRDHGDTIDTNRSPPPPPPCLLLALLPAPRPTAARDQSRTPLHRSCAPRYVQSTVPLYCISRFMTRCIRNFLRSLSVLLYLYHLPGYDYPSHSLTPPFRPAINLHRILPARLDVFRAGLRTRIGPLVKGTAWG